MHVRVQLFAGLAERVGRSVVELDLPAHATGRILKEFMARTYPEASAEIARALIARNQQFATDDQTVSDADEIALIPPVGGGSEDDDLCVITSSPLDIAAAYARLVDARHGGVTLFAGTVREWTAGRRTVSLDYQAYEAMALKQMRSIAAEVRREFPGAVPLQWHRIGRLYPTDIAVICGAGAPHRDTAFQVCRMLIERLKAEVPIWKKEHYADGDSEWKENHPI